MTALYAVALNTGLTVAVLAYPFARHVWLPARAERRARQAAQ